MDVTGFSIIAGSIATDRTSPFRSIDPATGRNGTVEFHAAGLAEVDLACRAAADDFDAFASHPPQRRADFLERCAAGIAQLGDALVAMVSSETGLAAPRVAGERDRTVNQFRFFAGLVREGSWVEAVIDRGDPARTPLPKPDLRRMLRPLGPIAVFGASNFPLAYSAGGGDTASALAAGCPVVVKGHPSHPGTGEMVAAAITRAARESSMPAGAFSYLHAGGTRELDIGRAVITHPSIKAGGFTGSLGGGMALARLAADRPDPIPVFAEMGSANPVFILPGAAENMGSDIAQRLHASVTNSAGQMCTCPGLIFVIRSAAADALINRLGELIGQTESMVMLSPRIRGGFIDRVATVESMPGVRVAAGGPHERPKTIGEQLTGGSYARPTLLVTDFAAFKAHHTLREECFGPSTLAIVCDSFEQLAEAAGLVDGSLTGTIWADPNIDQDAAVKIHRSLEQRAGRMIFNGVPTGVEVAPAMVHGGPYPATNQPHTSAVGSLALRRWCRPVCYQNCPPWMLAPELSDANPRGIWRWVDGSLGRS